MLIKKEKKNLNENHKIKLIEIIFLKIIAIGALLFSSFIALRYINQPLVDIHAFRQTQTALTSYWILKDGWTLAYQTPLAGYPWSIPFEFPIYQLIVSLIVKLTGFDLSATGRFISYFFLIACSWPAFAISRRLHLSNSVPLIFCALLWTSPIYVYWGRNFMIETAALFFILASIPYALDLFFKKNNWKSILFFWLFATASILQKITTGVPVLLCLYLFYLFYQIKNKVFNIEIFKALLCFFVIIIFPIMLGFLWTQYTDIIKTLNPFGKQLTSSSLYFWNFGTIKQKIDLNTWNIVIWNRSFVENAAGWLGLILLFLPWLSKSKEDNKVRWLSLSAIFLFLLPPFIFTNLHKVHDYYQVSNIVFLLGALAIIIGDGLKKQINFFFIVPIITIFIIFFNLSKFYSGYGIVVARELNSQDPRSLQSYKIGRYLNQITKEKTAIVVFGKDWTSEIAFHGQRKSFTIPSWFKEYQKVWEKPNNYLGGERLSAIVICKVNDDDKSFPNLQDIKARMQTEQNWIYKNIYGCHFLLSENELKINTKD
jgi:hypothetical protein